MGAFDYFVAELRCPGCDSVSDRDASTNIQTKIRPEPDLSELGCGDELEVSPALLAEAGYLPIPPPRSAYRLLQCWECSACGATNWALIVIDADRITSISDVPMGLETFESADYIHDGDLALLPPRNPGPGDPVELARRALAFPDDDDETYDEGEDYEPQSLRIARELLGVDLDASPTSVKRAYLRQVKQHRPERDPEGFQRVREAYERVRGDPAHVAVAPGASRTPMERPPAIAPRLGAAPGDVLAPYFARAGKLKRTDPELGELWREAVAALPENVAARQELYGTLISQEERVAAAGALVDAIRAGHSGFLRLLLTAHADRAPADLVERAEVDPELHASVLRAWVLQRDWKRAAKVAQAALDLATKTSERVVSLDDCITTLFGLAVGGSRGSVRELAERIGAYVEHAPRELHSSGLAAHWALAYELAESSKWMRPDAYEAMASALLAEDVGSGRQVLAHLLAGDPAAVRATVRRAPLLTALFDILPPRRPPEEPEAVLPEEPESTPIPHLEIPDPSEPRPSPQASQEDAGGSASPPVLHWVLSVSLLLVLAIFGVRLLQAKRETPLLPSDRTPVPATVDEEDDAPADISASDGGLFELEAAAIALIDYARGEKRVDAVRSARKILEAARSGNCDGVWEGIRELIRVEDITTPGHDIKLIELSLDLTDEGRALCPANRIEP